MPTMLGFWWVLPTMLGFWWAMPTLRIVLKIFVTFCYIDKSEISASVK